MGVKEVVATLQVLLLSLLAAIVVGSPAPQNFGIKSAIVGGQEAEPHQFPWQISLKYLDIWPHHYHTCGATIGQHAYRLRCSLHIWPPEKLVPGCSRSTQHPHNPARGHNPEEEGGRHVEARRLRFQHHHQRCLPSQTG